MILRRFDAVSGPGKGLLLEAAFYQARGFCAAAGPAPRRFLDEIMQPSLYMAATGQLPACGSRRYAGRHALAAIAAAAIVLGLLWLALPLGLSGPPDPPAPPRRS